MVVIILLQILTHGLSSLMSWRGKTFWSLTVSFNSLDRSIFRDIAISYERIPSDAKKSVWVPDGEGGFDEAMIDTIEGEKVSWKSCSKINFHFLLFVAGQRQSRLGGEDVQGEPAYASEPSQDGEVSLAKTCWKSQCLCFRFEDVSNMTYLNEASVLWNLKSRYVCKLIYVSWSSLTIDWWRPIFAQLHLNLRLTPASSVWWSTLTSGIPSIRRELAKCKWSSSVTSFSFKVFYKDIFILQVHWQEEEWGEIWWFLLIISLFCVWLKDCILMKKINQSSKCKLTLQTKMIKMFFICNYLMFFIIGTSYFW